MLRVPSEFASPVDRAWFIREVFRRAGLIYPVADLSNVRKVVGRRPIRGLLEAPTPNADGEHGAR